MSFKDMIAADNVGVFLDTDFFAEERTIKYDGATYEKVKCIISQTEEKERSTTMRDHAQGLYLVTAVFHCNADDLGGIVPEKGGKILISDGGFMQRFYIAQSGCEMGMIRLELEAIDE